MELRVSVIIPVYNVLPFLREALDSVINQTYRALEIIIIDDGSTDGSDAVCDEYQTDSRVKVIHQENHGLSGARNTGLNHVTGDYVAFLDPDDAFCPDMIKIMMDILLNQNADMVTCGYDVYETEGQLTEAKPINCIVPSKDTVLTAAEVLNAMLEGKYSVCVWNKLYKRKILEDLRFPEGHVYEDVYIAPFIIEQCERITVISRALVHHRQREGSIYQTNTFENARDFIDMQRMTLERFKSRQESFTQSNIRLFHENVIRSMIMKWAELKNPKRQGVTAELRAQILEYVGRDHHFQRIKSRIVWVLFRYCPGLLIPFRNCYWQAKKFLKMERKVVA